MVIFVMLSTNIQNVFHAIENSAIVLLVAILLICGVKMKETEKEITKEKNKVKQERAQRLQKIRLSKNLTQLVMAEKLEVSDRAYIAVEQGINNFSLDMLTKLREKYNISSDYLLYGDEKSIEDVWTSISSYGEIDKIRIFFLLAEHFLGKKISPGVDRVDRLLQYAKSLVLEK